MKLRKFLVFSFALAMTFSAMAEENRPSSKGKQRKSAAKALQEACSPATAEVDLNINNVRARILGSGDMWWDFNRAQYEVPKGSNKHSMFAGALWLGGIDDADNLKLAAMTYRSGGVDYWTGPLSDDNTASVDRATCEAYDQHWVVFRDEVEIHRAWIACKEDPENCDLEERFPGYAPAGDILDWPGNGINNILPNKLAPYFESDKNGVPGVYEPDWDYPGYDFAREFDCKEKGVDVLYGDQTIWWVYNDKGNIHQETQAGALGFEIRAQAFAFTSNDEINNMTFNNYRIINKSTFRLKDTYFGTWFDPDIGNAFDDVIGSDIPRGLGYCYNSDPDDEGPNGYGLNPPAVGFDFFQGPFADFFDGLDNDRDGCVDAVRNKLGVCIPENVSQSNPVNERIIMSGFMYYNNGGGNFSGPEETTDPDNAGEFYNYLQSLWKNGNPLVIENPSGKGDENNGDGFTQNGTGQATKFAYPGLSFDTTGVSDPKVPSDWWESPQNRADKRGLHTAGPFSLAPGALNFITTGVVWSRNFTSQDIFASVNDVIVADDKAQQLFDNCFQILDGPNSPTLEIVELNRQLILKLNPSTNAGGAFDAATFGYDQIDPLIRIPSEWSAAQIDSATQAGYFSYRFEGFQIFQVANADVSVDQLYEPTLARLIAQSDLKNDITQLVNYTPDVDLDGSPLTGQDMTLTANNEGIVLNYSLTEDVFATGTDRRLVNNREYYFYVIAYSQNQYVKFDPRSNNDDFDAQKTPYLAGRRIGNGSKPYLGIPYRSENVNGGTILNASFGDEIDVTRLAGQGNGGTFVRIADQVEQQIVSQGKIEQLDYLPGAGPVEIKVVDPFSVVSGNYLLAFDGDSPNSNWVVTSTTGSDTLKTSDFPLSFLGEQVIEDLGVSITILNQEEPGFDTSNLRNNGFIGAEIIYNDPRRDWLGGLVDTDEDVYPAADANWIRAGAVDVQGAAPADRFNDFGDNIDLDGVYETILGGTWAPFAFTASDGDYSVKPSAIAYSDAIAIEDAPNIDIVITSDHTKWSRCPVVEMGFDQLNNDDEVPKFQLRSAPSLDKDANGNLVPSSTSTGWSYFPGYAINVENGKRLNIFFGESSFIKSDNGDDMLWNPTFNTNRLISGRAFGGMHTIYVMADSIPTGATSSDDLVYQGDNIDDYPYKDEFEDLARQTNLRRVYTSIAWASIPILNAGFVMNDYSEIPTETKVSIRMAKPYKRTGPSDSNGGFPLYSFSTDGYQGVQGNLEVAKSALDNIRVVPNPYFGSSLYEDSQLDNIVKITNLPPKCKISIFMTNGTSIRTINKDNSLTFVEWDMKNDFNVPIASGIYLIHIDAGAAGQKVVKWMGSLRPADLNAF